MMIPWFCLIAILFSGSEAINPGVRIQLNNPGLAYLKGIGIQALNNNVKQIPIPDISGKAGPGDLLEYDLSHFKIDSFSATNSNTKIGLSPPSTVTLSATGVSATINADYKIIVGTWFKVTKTGTVTASASGIGFSQGIAVSQSNGKPHVTAAGKCAASIGDLKLTFHGDLVDSILNLFSGLIIGYVKGQLTGLVCSALPSLINGNANSLLNKIPTSIDVTDGFYIDYSLTGNPAVEGTNDVVIPFKGEIWYTGHHTDPKIPQAAPMTALASGNSQMACVEASPIGLVGSLGYAAQVAGILHIELTKSALQSFGVGKYMACNCSNGQCIGAFIPQIQSKCGTGGTVEINIKSTAAPTAYATERGIFMSFAGDLDFKGDISGKEVELFTASATMGAVIPAANLTFEGWVIKGDVAVTGASLAVKSSNIGKLDEAGLQQIWQLALLGILQGLLDGVTKGFSINYGTLTVPTWITRFARMSPGGNF